MTLTGPDAPTGVPTSTFPWRLEPYSNITPFTVRDGATYLQELLELKKWLSKSLVPYVDATIAAYVTAFNDALQQVNDAFDQIETYVTTQIGVIDTKVAAFNVAATAAEAAVQALVTAAQTAATQSAASAVTAAGWASTEYNIQDTNVGTLIGTSNTNTHAALMTFIQAYAAANGFELNVKSFGAKGDGVTDDTVAFNTALSAFTATGGKLIVPQGHYIISAELDIPQGSVHLSGAGRNSTLITTASPTNNGIVIGINGAFTTLSGFSLENTGTPTAGAGIVFGTTNAGTYSTIKDVYVRGFFVGILLQSSIMGWLEKVVVEACHSDGIQIKNDSSSACQWQFNNVLSQGNHGDGIDVGSVNGLGAGQLILGNWHNVATFSNDGYGLVLQGSSSTPVQDARIFHCFFGNDSRGGVYIDSYGGSHQLDQVFTELVGTGGTGINLATPASHVGHGIVITPNNNDVSITGGKDNGNSQCGIYTNAEDTTITGRSTTNNGQNSDAADTSNCGIYNAGGNLNVTGCSIYGQPIAIATATDTVLVVGNTLKSPGSAFVKPEFVTLTNSVVANNRQLVA